jgi:hypothetical protein
MQVGTRQVLTIEKPRLILKVLNALAMGVESEGGEPFGTLMRLEEFAKEGCGRLILNLRAVDESLRGTPQGVEKVGASLIGGVLVVTCQVTTPCMLQINELCRPRLVPKRLVSPLGALLRTLFSALRPATQHLR